MQKISLVRLNGELGNYDEALKYCEAMLDKEIALLKAISFKAQMMQAKGQGREAINFIKKVLNSGHQENDSLWTLLSSLFENEGHYEVALKCLFQAKTILNSQEDVNQENLEYLNKKIEQIKSFLNH